MKIAKIIALMGLIAMTGVLVYGFTVGNFSAEGAKLLAMPWGIVSLVDLYVGFSLVFLLDRFSRKSGPTLRHLGDLDDGAGILGGCVVYADRSPNLWK